MDLDYAEDSNCGTDANFVITGRGGIVEVQGTAEGEPFSEAQLLELLGPPSRAWPGSWSSRRWRWPEMARQLTGKAVLATHNAASSRRCASCSRLTASSSSRPGSSACRSPRKTARCMPRTPRSRPMRRRRRPVLPALSDDSGLSVDLIDGAPGLFTADWAGHPRSWERRCSACMTSWRPRPCCRGAAARFVSALVIAWPDGHEELFEGRCFGKLTWPPRGKAGFGYYHNVRAGRPCAHLRRADVRGEARAAASGHGPVARGRAFMALAEACLKR